jgi:hypothetical protein
MDLAPQLEQITSRIEPQLRRRLKEKAAASLRSESAEINLAVRAWVESNEAADHSAVSFSGKAPEPIEKAAKV